MPEKIYTDISGVSGTYVYRADESIEIFAETSDSSAAVITGKSKATFEKKESGEYILTTYVLKNGAWVPFFDSGKPLIQGADFNVLPDSCVLETDTDQQKTLLLTGRNSKYGYDVEIRVSVYTGNPLIHFSIVNRLKSALKITDYGPIAMLWRNGKPSDLVSINQETPNYQTVDDTVYWYSGFPASYMYTDGMGSAVYFDVTDMKWFSSSGIARFNQCQVRTDSRDGMTGCGLDLRISRKGKYIAAGDVKFDFYLYAGPVEKAPTKLEALSAEVEAFGYALSSDSGSPKNYIDGTLTYRHYTEKIIEGLMTEDVTYSWNEVRKGGTFIDNPLISGSEVSRLLQRNGYVSVKGEKTSHFGDWNCNNNCLIPWILIERLNPDSSQKALIDETRTGLLAYFDNIARIYRSFDPYEGYEGKGKEFTFQNYTMNYCSLWAGEFSGNSDFNPALGGKFLIAMDGFEELAKNTGYLQPQLIDVENKKAALSIDETSLGAVQEAWSGGFYAYCMCYAYSVTGDVHYLDEARAQMDTLFGGLEYYVNDLKQKYYTDPYEFPVNEVNSVAYGVAACQWIYRFTGDSKYIAYANDIRNLTLRMMKWYESAVDSDPIDQALSSISFFNAFSKTDTTCPWESIQTYLPMLMELKNTDYEVSQALLKAYNLFRKNAFSFSGASWDPKVVNGAADYQKAITAFFTPESYYSLEIPTNPTHQGANQYMSCTIMYAYLMFEAYAEADNADMMVVNTDIVDAGYDLASGLKRTFLAFNPLAETMTFNVIFHDLRADTKYTVTVLHEDGRRVSFTLSGTSLKDKGIEIKLQGARYAHITVSVSENDGLYASLTQAKEARFALMTAYGRIQGQALTGKVNTRLYQLKSDYDKAVAMFDEGNYEGVSVILNQ
ncbi:MAG: hypothetical protein IKS28_03095 [Clostridia bacterium]|nr:hypothetical protein [Clostridia bacterium]